MVKTHLKLDGLGCANCAAKIENRSKDIEGVENLVLDFARSKITFTSMPSSSETVIKQIEDIVHDLEPDVRVEKITLNTSKVNGYRHNKKELIRLVTSLGLLIMAFIVPWSILKILLFMTAYLLSGYKVLAKSLRNIRNRDIFDENFLMALATFGAIAIGEYPEAVAVMIFYEIGEYFQDLAINRSKSTISSLLDIRPDTATVKRDGIWQTVSPEMVLIGETILVKPGERIPLDGIIRKGSADIDTSALTGESLPVHVSKDANVLSGSVVKNAILEIQTTTLFRESTVAKILDLVENATQHKAPTENFITKFARYYTPIVVFLAIGLALIPPFLLQIGTFSTWLYRSLIFLVISCPCALVVSVPLGFFSGLGNASSHGILVKGSNYLEALNGVDTVVFDKTGTLTEGRFEVASVMPAPTISKETLLEYAVSAEQGSNHPIAKSIVAYGKAYLSHTDHVSYHEISGKGVLLNLNSETVLAGNRILLKEHGIDVPHIESPYTVVYVAKNKTYLGAIDIRDALKPDAGYTIQALNKLGKKTILLTGDRDITAQAVSSTLNINETHSQLLPEEKYTIVQNLISQGHKVAFLGDGINDAPVLAGATVGISMGSIGSDAAIEASDIVFMTDEPSKIVHAMQIAAKTKFIVKQNIVFALSTKIIIMGLGIVGLSSMWMAIFADVGVALLAVLNAVRILHYVPKLER
ncbi:heavy metal translocating P-type ATPase [Fusibacter tunisiensis]|uniref:Cd(2+)-exporting ATPase n=1 Tax=Fusibacter tunisiensis TaxID=1008308 RepID=A0ABS2MRG9_9FIRM|nr:heavy metal translocating P-type ATPase [Fusibacter tunisiensis]MBM7562013.1 Cd2+/Zn2+-exporting ATPase [Fusibacter tunisiensis]